MTRERLPPGGKRSASASCRLTRSERALLDFASKLEGRPITEFVRAAIVKHSAALIEDAAAAMPKEALIAFHRELSTRTAEAERLQEEAAEAANDPGDGKHIEERA